MDQGFAHAPRSQGSKLEEVGAQEQERQQGAGQQVQGPPAAQTQSAPPEPWTAGVAAEAGRGAADVVEVDRRARGWHHLESPSSGAEVLPQTWGDACQAPKNPSQN